MKKNILLVTISILLTCPAIVAQIMGPPEQLEVEGAIKIAATTNFSNAADGTIQYFPQFGFQFRHFGTWESLNAYRGWDEDLTGYFTFENIGIGSTSNINNRLSVVGASTSAASFNNAYLDGSSSLTNTYGIKVENGSTGNVLDNSYGVYADVTASSGKQVGIYGKVNDADGIAVYGTTSGSTSAYAGHLEGKVKIVGVNDNDSRIDINPNTTNSPTIILFDNDNEQKITIKGDIGDGNPSMLWKNGTRDVMFMLGGRIDLRSHRAVSQGKIQIDAHTFNNPFISLTNSANKETVRLTADHDGDGEGRVITDELQINGGSDLSENFDILNLEDAEKNVIPGMIVSIDPNSTGKLQIADQSYDKKVAGIISGANGVKPGMLMGQKGTIADGDYPVALAGRVYVKANHQGGKIEPGDLLTTSDRSGEAMKVNDYVKAQGAIIGKAMTEIDENGFVLVLVNLQ